MNADRKKCEDFLSLSEIPKLVNNQEIQYDDQTHNYH